MKIEKYHFIGLGGIGMSALARILLQKGYHVSGSDAANSPWLEQLKAEGIDGYVGHRADLSFENTAVVYSSAIPESNVEWIAAKKKGALLLHRSDLLATLMHKKKNLLVTGTHGKTTTTALLASTLMEAGCDPTMALGGFLRSIASNSKLGSGDYFVAEADESDGSFLKKSALGAIVTNLGRDHLNFWKSEERLREAFAQFFSQVEERSHLFWCIDDPQLRSLSPLGISYGFSAAAELHIFDFRLTAQGIQFSLRYQGAFYRAIDLSLLGAHNALNGAAVFGLALSLGISEEMIRKAFRAFQGVSRRLEKKGEAHSLSLYDDYGHHPTEIAATLRALRGHIRERRLVVIFQPHRYSRVADLWKRFFSCFEEADELILTNIYAASEEPIAQLTDKAFYEAMQVKLGSKVRFIPRNNLEVAVIDALQPLDVVLTLGAGDITDAGSLILERFEKKAPHLKAALLCGGTSAERDVSLLSAANILKGLNPAVYQTKVFGVTKEGQWFSGSDAMAKLAAKDAIASQKCKVPPEVLEELADCDIAIPVFHGPQGEDGMMQAFLDTLQIPYVGCEYRGAALCMQKAWTKYAAIIHHIPTVPFIEMRREEYRLDPESFLTKIEESLSYPVWIKAVHLGSSLGVSRAANREEARRGAELSFQYDEQLIVEKEIKGREIEFAVLGNEHIRVINSCEILAQGGFYDYDKKYGAQAAGVETPARLSPLEKMVGEDLAARAYLACGCKGMARVDFFLDSEGHYWLNEINPFPGFTAMSGYPKMCAAAGMNLSCLLNDLIALGLQRSRSLAKIRGK